MITESSRRLVTALVAVALAGVVGGCARFESRMELKNGNKAYRLGKYEEALNFYANVPVGSGDRVRAALNSGYANMAQYRFGSKHPKDLELATKAVKAFDEYIALRPEKRKDSKEFPSVHEVEERIVTLLVDAGYYEEAIGRLEKKLAEHPDDAALMRGLATTYDKWDKPTIAIRYYQEWADRLREEGPSAYVAIGAYTWNMSYRRNLTMEPIERNRWIDIGLEAVQSALEIDPENFEGTLYKNLLLRERAKVRINPDQISDLIDEANALLTKAKEIQAAKKAEEEAKAKEAAAAAGEPETNTDGEEAAAGDS